MATRKGVETILDSRPREPAHHGCRTELDKNTLPSVLHRRKPGRLEGDLRALDVCLIFTIDVWRHCLKACETHESKDLAQAVELNHSFNTVATLGVTPCVIGQPASVKVLIYGYVIGTIEENVIVVCYFARMRYLS
jgi:ABC-type nickel/cobalt efflux system permease component RcnA